MEQNNNLNPMFDREYAKLALNKPAKERYDLGGVASIIPVAAGKVMKKEKENGFGLKDEAKAMAKLWKHGFHAMPKPLSYNEDTLIMEQIHDGATLKEALDLYKSGDIPDFCIDHILDILRDVLNDFWQTGASHGDLHANNILIGKDAEGEWKVWLIDFASTSWLDPEQGQKNDKNRLDTYLSHYGLDL